MKWSPGLKYKKKVEIAAIPDANQIQNLPCYN